MVKQQQDDGVADTPAEVAEPIKFARLLIHDPGVPDTTGPDVALVLTAIGGAGDAYDAAARAAVQAWQDEHNVTGDPRGVVGPHTVAALGFAWGREGLD